MSPLPTLRSDLERVEARVDGQWVLRDPITGDLHTFSALAAHIAQRLDGSHTLASLLDALRSEGHGEVPEVEVRAFVAELGERLLLVDGTTAGQLAAFRVARIAERRAQMGQFEAYRGPVDFHADEITVREDLRYACRSCGVCCSGRFRVQLTARDLAGLSQLDLAQLGLELAQAVEHKTLAGDLEGDKVAFLAQRDGRCVFLEETGLCAIHRAFGYATKPVGCRIFPFYPLITPLGGVVQFRPECSTQHLSRRTGPRIFEGRAALWAEITSGLEVFPALPRVVALTSGHRVSYGEAEGLEVAWLEVAREQGWRAGFARMAGDLDIPVLRRGRPMQDVLTAVLLYAEEDRRLLGRARQDHTFEHVFGRRAGSLQLFEVLLATTGIVRPDADITQLSHAVERVLATLPIVQRPDFDAIITDYLLTFVSSKYAYHGFTLAAGLGLCALAVFAARRTVTYASAVSQRAVTVDLMNEALVAWHLLIFNHDTLRGQLVAHHDETLEALVGMPGERF